MSEPQGSGAERGAVGALGYDEAARYLGVKRSWLEHSDVPRVKLGRRVVFRIVDLDTYLERRVA
jgi:predicted DNA-binding transcriptional regulator AlpA